MCIVLCTCMYVQEGPCQQRLKVVVILRDTDVSSLLKVRCSDIASKGLSSEYHQLMPKNGILHRLSTVCNIQTAVPRRVGHKIHVFES